MRNIKYIVLYLIFMTAFYAKADVRIAPIFANHMVLQRDTKLPIWGFADPCEAVTVQFADQTAKTFADVNGNWQVILNPVNSDKPLSMFVKGENVVEINDILMGEVWICSGQSNMGVTVQECYNVAEEIADSNYPNIRLYEVEHRVCPEPDRTLGGSWKNCTPETAANYTAVGFFFAREIYKQLKVPIGLVHTSWGGTPAEAWTDWNALKSNPKLSNLIARFEKACENYPENQAAFDARMQDWERKAKLAKEAGIEPPPQPFITPMGPTHFQRPSGLYNGMVLSVVPFAMRGVLWYQGECNAGRPLEYADILPTMINSWRKVWNQGDFPFYIVQISSWSRLQDNPNELSGWPLVRYAQSKTAEKLANCHLVVTVDIGDADTNHPKNKQDVGKRLAAAALAREYGREVPYKSPTYKSMTSENGKLRLHFDNTEGQLVSKLTGFVIAGEDMVYHWADARIEGDTILLSSEKVSNPVAVRYAWANNPPCSLYNKEGFPADPFQAQLPNICVVDASEDAYIDSNQPDTNFGSSRYLRIENGGTPNTERYALIRWDLSSFVINDFNQIDNVTFRGTQIDGPVGNGFDVYAISVGDWNETEITWNIWHDKKTEIAFLGAMNVMPYPDGLSIFSSPLLADWVRVWLKDPKKNCGLLLKYHYGTSYDGDTLFATGDPEAFYLPPQLVIHTKSEKSVVLEKK
ncbi:MAG: sialate O-acetylesterase [Phycisphaerales bacterium]